MFKNYNVLSIFVIFVYLLSYTNSKKCIIFHKENQGQQNQGENQGENQGANQGENEDPNQEPTCSEKQCLTFTWDDFVASPHFAEDDKTYGKCYRQYDYCFRNCYEDDGYQECIAACESAQYDDCVIDACLRACPSSYDEACMEQKQCSNLKFTDLNSLGDAYSYCAYQCYNGDCFAKPDSEKEACYLENCKDEIESCMFEECRRECYKFNNHRK